MTNPTPVEYCRHENCGKEIRECGHDQKHRNKCKGYVHLDDGYHYCCMNDNSDQVAEPADPCPAPYYEAGEQNESERIREEETKSGSIGSNEKDGNFQPVSKVPPQVSIKDNKGRQVPNVMGVPLAGLQMEQNARPNVPLAADPPQQTDAKQPIKESSPVGCLAFLPRIVKVAREKGYALTVHGSMARDFDFVAIPWNEDAVNAEELAEAIKARCGAFTANSDMPNGYVKPHGRLAFKFHLGGGPYMDLSIMPKLKAGTQMEERKPDAIINFVKDMIDRAENAHESKPGICVEIPVFMADIARIKQSLRNDVSESANREPQASHFDLEEIGRIMHESWAKTKRAQGFHGPKDGCVPCDESKEHSIMGGFRCPKFHADLIPWEQLPEKQKDINRHAFDEVLVDCQSDAAEKTGCDRLEITPPLAPSRTDQTETAMRETQGFHSPEEFEHLVPITKAIGGNLANIYDDQFRERALRQRQFCDPTSAEIIGSLVEYLDRHHAAVSQRLVSNLQIELDGAKRELHALRAQIEQLTAFSLLQKECVIAAEEMYGTCLGAYPNSSETARTEACREFLQLNDAVGRHPLDDKFLGMTDWKDTAASLRGLVGRMNTALVKCDSYLSLLRHRCERQIAWGTPGLPHDTNEVDEVIGKARAISKEAEAAIKEPHNG